MLTVIAVLGIAATTIAPAATATPSGVLAPTENVATRWVGRALGAVRSGSPSQHTSTPGAARTYAMTTSAMYDAVNGIDVASGLSTRRSAIVESYAAAPPGASREAATSAAAHSVLSSLFATNPAVKSTLDSALEQELALLDSAPAVEAGRSWGASVGEMVLAARANDGTQAATSRPGGTGAGAFPRTFSGTQFRTMSLFGISAIEPYRSPGPPALTSDEYAAAVNEVKALGSSTDRDPERAAIAKQWFAEGGTVRETGLWLKAALEIAAVKGTTASLSDTARLFALLGMGIADAVTVSWNDKYDWMYWRPGDAIRQASIDGNAKTTEDRTWSPRNGTCASANVTECAVFGGTPEHTSGTSTFAGAASTILAGFYGTDAVRFSFAGEQPNAPARFYVGFSEAAREAGRSRIFGGIHFQFSNELGREAGKGIGREITRTQLLPA